jgi:hypothetical protein
MHLGPSRIAARLVAFFTPPACREEIIGDLHERFKSRRQYALDALRTVPLVIVSRMRRTVDLQIVVIQAFALYASFLAAAQFGDPAMLREQWGLLRLAIPAAMVVAGLILNDTYTTPRPQPTLSLARGPVLGLLMVLVSQGLFHITSPILALHGWIVFYGCAISLLLSSAIRAIFPPITQHIRSPNAPAFWLKRAGESEGDPQRMTGLLPRIAAIVASGVLGLGIAKHAVLPGTIGLLLLLAVAYQMLRRGS